jgi:hypothetical protein
MYLHIPPWAPYTYDCFVLTSLTHPRKILLVVLQIGNMKSQRLISTPRYSYSRIVQGALIHYRIQPFETVLSETWIAQSVMWLGYGRHERRIMVRFPEGVDISIITVSIPALGRASLLLIGYCGILSSGVKRQELEAETSVIAEVKNTCSGTLLPPTSSWSRYYTSVIDPTEYRDLLFLPWNGVALLLLATHVHLVPKLRMHGVMSVLPHTSLCLTYSITDRNEYRDLFSRGDGTGFLKLNTHVHVMPRLRKCGVMPLLPYTSLWHRCSTYNGPHCVPGPLSP